MTTPDLDHPTAATAGRLGAASRRHQHVLTTITTAITRGDPAALAVAAVARSAGVHRSYLYRHPELVGLLHQAAHAPAAPLDTEQVTAASLRADLAHAQDRATRAEATVRRLERRLSQSLGQHVWAESGLGPMDEAAELRNLVQRLQQQLADTGEQLEQRDGELDAARAANRELMAKINASRPC